MEKTRVPKGGNYWCIEISMGVIEIVSYIDNRHYCDNRAYESGNYYCDKDEAECVARKLQAVLKGAEVIEMPSEDEIIIKASNATKGNDLSFIDGNTRFEMAYELLKWICSKIVK